MKRVKLVEQSDSMTCGPACISMVSGTSEEQVLDILGKRFDHGLLIKDMAWCLNKLDVCCSKVQADSLWLYSEKAILTMRSHFHRNARYKDYGHYLVYFKNKFYDPYFGIRTDLFHHSWADEWIKVKRYIDIYD